MIPFRNHRQAAPNQLEIRGMLLAMAVWGIAALATAPVTADEAKDEAIRKDRQRIEGTWRIVALEIDGQSAKEADARKLTVINGPDGTWSLLSAGKVISKGTSTIDPMKNPKTIDFTATEGDGNGDRYHGIYKLGDKTRRMCFAPAGKDRPAAFASAPGSKIILVTFERETQK